MMDLTSILGASFLGLKVKAWLALVALAGLLAFIVIQIFDNRDKRLIETATDAGTTKAIVAGQETTLDQLGDANDAEAALNRGGERNAERYAQCLLDSDRPAACERYRPATR